MREKNKVLINNFYFILTTVKWGKTRISNASVSRNWKHKNFETKIIFFWKGEQIVLSILIEIHKTSWDEIVISFVILDHKILQILKLKIVFEADII